MKKTLLFAAAALMMVACQENQNLVPEQGAPILFEAPVMAPLTKADGDYISNVDFPTDWTFMVASQWYANAEAWATTGWDASSLYFPARVAQKTTLEGLLTWTTSPASYWPKDGVLAFQAYAPSMADKAAITNSGVTFGTPDDLYVADTTGSQHDLLFSDRVKDQTKANCVNNGNYHGIQLTFNHALSSIKFKAQTAADYSASTTITIKGLSLKNTCNQGYFNQGIAEVEGHYTALSGTPVWAGQTNPATYANVVNVEKTVSHELSNAPVDTKPLLVIPQAVAADKVILVVEYTIQNGEGAAIEQVAEIPFSNFSTGSHLNIPDDFNQLSALEIGKQYTVNLVFTLDEIHFYPVVNAWVDVTLNEYEVIDAAL